MFGTEKNRFSHSKVVNSNKMNDFPGIQSQDLPKMNTGSSFEQLYSNEQEKIENSILADKIIRIYEYDWKLPKIEQKISKPIRIDNRHRYVTKDEYIERFLRHQELFNNKK